jgi:hypothetical protein
MLAKRWCGREAILMDVRRAAEDMVWRYRKQDEVDSREEQEESVMRAERWKMAIMATYGYHMAAAFRRALAEDWS